MSQLQDQHKKNSLLSILIENKEHKVHTDSPKTENINTHKYNISLAKLAQI